MPYQIWNPYIDSFKNDFHVIVPVMPGHYPNQTKDFISFSETARVFENNFLAKYSSDVYAIYAVSMGGVLAATLWQNRRLNIEKIIFDGSPLRPLNRFLENMLTRFYLDVTHKTQQRHEKTLEQAKNIYPKALFTNFLKVLDTMTDTTIRNCVKGVVNFQLADIPDEKNTGVYYFHGTKPNELFAKLSSKILSSRYKNTIVKTFAGKSHCETMAFSPQVMIKELESILIYNEQSA